MKTAREIIKTAMYSCGIEKNIIDQALAELRKLIKEQRPENKEDECQCGYGAPCNCYKHYFDDIVERYDEGIDEVMK